MVNAGVCVLAKEAAASGSAQRMQAPSATELPMFQEVRNLDV